MSIHAGFFKRLFAFVVDLTLVILTTWLLYLFPFQQIIGKSIDSDYKNNVKTPYNNISDEYSGTVSYFGSSTDGYFTVLSNEHTNGYMTEAEYQKYILKQKTAYNTVTSVLDSSIDEMNVAYDSTKAENEQFYSKLYEVYEYFNFIYQIKSNFQVNDEYILYSVIADKGEMTSEEQSAAESAYKAQAKEDYKNEMKLLLNAMKNYDELNSSISITKQIAYTTILSSYTSAGGSSSDLTSTYTADDVTALKAYVDAFKAYQDVVTSTDRLGYQTVDGVQNVNLNDEAYYHFYYALQFEMFDAQLPYYVKVYNHTNWAIIYALSAFTLIFSIYTAAMRGQTLGRRCLKIKLTDGHEKEKVNPIIALLHDVPFRFLYIIVLGMFSLLIALIVAAVFTLADGIMIWKTREHKCIRDYITKTRVVDHRAY